MFEKSFNYCYSGFETNQSSQLMLLCEVALGKMEIAKEFKQYDEPPKGCNSVKANGIEGPDYDKTIVM